MDLQLFESLYFITLKVKQIDQNSLNKLTSLGQMYNIYYNTHFTLNQ